MHRLRKLIPSANCLFVFEAAARLQNFSKAAQELNVSQPAVSKSIRLLEQATSLKLFERGRRRLELTPDGRRLYAEARECLDRMESVITSLQRQRAREHVRVSFSASFIQLWLMPRLKDFKARWPHIALRIEESTRDDLDLAEEKIDISARLGKGKWPGIESFPFVTEEIWPVCSPDYLAERGPIVGPRDVIGHPLLHIDEKHRLRIGWRDWFVRNRLPVSALSDDVVFTDALSAIEAAVRGQGLALGWKHLIRDYIVAGKLVRPLKEAYKTGASVYLTLPAKKAVPSGTTLFCDWLLAQDPDAPIPNGFD